MVRFKKGHFLESPVDERVFSSKVHPVINIVGGDVRIDRGEVSVARETQG